jgi:hypothetical protein
MDPVLDPMQLRKSGSAGYRARDLWISSREVWPLDHRGGHSEEQRMCIYHINLFLKGKIKMIPKDFNDGLLNLIL